MEPRSPARVLVVARRDPLEPIGGGLKRAGYAVRWVDNGRMAARLLERRPPDIVILESGYLDTKVAETLSSIASEHDVPLLVIQRRDSHESVVERLASLTRETDAEGTVTSAEPQTLISGSLSVDLVRHTALAGGIPLKLTPKEFELLSLFMQQPGRIWSQQQLLYLIWGYDYADPRVVPVHVSNVRKKLGRAAPRVPFIETVRGLGYRFTDPTERTGQDHGDDSHVQPLLGPLPFVGRKRELEVLERAVEAVVHGELKIVAIDGDAGVGKTRLAEEVADYARQLGADTYWGTCRQILARPAYEPWLDILGQWEAEGPPGQITSVFKPEPQEPARSPRESTRARMRLLGRGLETVRRRAESSPLCLIIDDIHWADTSTLVTLQHLVQRLQDVPLMLILTYRLHDAIQAALLTDVVAEVARSDSGLVLTLHPFSREEVDRFLEDSGCAGTTPECVDEVYRVTEGNPFFLTQLARLVALQTEPSLSVDSVLALCREQGIRCVVLERLRHLSPECMDCLDAASVIGPSFTAPLLSAAMDLRIEEVSTRLSEAANLRVVFPDEDAPERYRFAHNMFREVIYQEIPPPVRAETHARLATALEALHGDELDPVAAELAHHFGEAALVGYAEEAVKFSYRAGRVAATQCAWEEACSHWRRTLALVETLPDEAQSPGWRFVGEVYENLAMAHRATGEFDEAIQAYEQATIWIPSEETIWQARLKREQSFCLNTSGQHVRAETVLMEARTKLGQPGAQDKPEWWQEWIAIHMERALPPFYDADLDELRSVATDLEEAVAAHGTAKHRAQLNLIKWLVDLRGRRYEATDETVALAQVLSESFEATGSPEDLKSAEGALAMTLVLSPKHRTRAETHLNRHWELSRQSQDVTFQVRALWALGIYHRLRGDVEATRDNALQALSLIGEKPIVSYGARARGNLSWVAWRTGDLLDAKRLAAEGLREFGDLVPRCPFEWHARWTLLGLGLSDGRREDAETQAFALLDISQQKMPTEVENVLRLFTERAAGVTPAAITDEELMAVAGAHGYL